MTDEELVDLHDKMVVGIGNYTVGPDYYLRELARREQERQTESMVEQTATMVKLTKWIGLLTVVNVVAVVVGVILAA